MSTWAFAIVGTQITLEKDSWKVVFTSGNARPWELLPTRRLDSAGFTEFHPFSCGMRPIDKKDWFNQVQGRVKTAIKAALQAAKDTGITSGNIDLPDWEVSLAAQALTAPTPTVDQLMVEVESL